MLKCVKSHIESTLYYNLDMNKIGKKITLSNGVAIPSVGLGVWRIDNSEVEQSVIWALQAGYRHIDTAVAYRNEIGVGKGVRNIGVARKNIFVTTKLLVFDFFRVKKAFNDSLRRLNLDYVDLYLLHWPFFGWKRAWKVLESIYESGKARAIGVSNFSIEQLKDLKKLGGVVPMVNQIEISPFLYRQKLIEYCQSEGIVVEAYSPLTRGKRLKDMMVVNIAKQYKKAPAQIMIRWGLQHGLVVLPKSADKDRIESNLDVYDFEIEAKDMRKLDALNENYSALIPGWSRGE